MTKITVQPDCGNSPKMEFLKNFTVAFANNDDKTILDSVDDNLVWEVVGQETVCGKEGMKKTLEDMLDSTMTELTLTNIITHGDAGSVNGTMKFKDGMTCGFCDVYTFTSHAKDAKLKTITSYIVELKS